MTEYLISDIAKFLDGQIEGDPNITIFHISKIEEAKKGDLSFIANPKYVKYADTTHASAIIVSEDFLTTRKDITYIKVPDPYFAFLKVLEKIETPIDMTPLCGIHPTAIISKSATIGEDVYIGPYTIINDDCKVGNKAILLSNIFLGKKSSIGENSLIYPNVVIREKCSIGINVIIHSGTVIGSDGFGFVPQKDGTYQKIPQLGGVIIEDNIEIGSNCAIDRATIGDTILKKGTKLDNLIHIAHNVIIGENNVIAGQSGIAGSTKIGNNCVIAAQVGITGHIELADRTTVGAKSGVSKSLKQPGKTYFGIPAKEYRIALRTEGAVRQLPDFLKEIQELKKQIQTLENSINKK